MSVIKRIISGSLASWSSVFLTLGIQIGLVPFYLKYWDKDTYALWLAIQSLSTLLTILDKSFQNFLGFEFLKLGEKQLTKILKLLSSGLVVALFSGLIQLVIVFVFDFINISQSLVFNSNLNLKDFEEADNALILLSFSWFLSGNIGGILTRSLSPFGYYPRMAWWSVLNIAVTNILPGIALLFNSSLFFIALIMSLSSIIVNLFLYIDILKLFKKLKFKYGKPSLEVAKNIFMSSLILTVSNLLVSVRQEGVRLILAPLSGSNALVSFTTTRTGANAALQGLNTITGPLLPELMRFLRNKEQEKSEITFSTVWSVLIYFMAPGVVILQFIMPSIFKIWTLGKIEYNPVLFSLLSLGVLIYALAQPAISITKGNNDIKSQIVITSIAATVVLLSMFILVSYFGVVGAGISLMLGELIDTFLYKYSAKKWLNNNGLNWPNKTYKIAVNSLIITSISLFFIVYDSNYTFIILFVFSIIYIVNAVNFYNSLPLLAKEKIYTILNKFFKIYKK